MSAVATDQWVIERWRDFGDTSSILVSIANEPLAAMVRSGDAWAALTNALCLEGDPRWVEALVTGWHQALSEENHGAVAQLAAVLATRQVSGPFGSQQAALRGAARVLSERMASRAPANNALQWVLRAQWCAALRIGGDEAGFMRDSAPLDSAAVLRELAGSAVPPVWRYQVLRVLALRHLREAGEPGRLAWTIGLLDEATVACGGAPTQTQRRLFDAERALLAGHHLESLLLLTLCARSLLVETNERPCRAEFIHLWDRLQRAVPAAGLSRACPVRETLDGVPQGLPQALVQLDAALTSRAMGDHPSLRLAWDAPLDTR